MVCQDFEVGIGKRLQERNEASNIRSEQLIGNQDIRYTVLRQHFGFAQSGAFVLVDAGIARQSDNLRCLMRLDMRTEFHCISLNQRDSLCNILLDEVKIDDERGARNLVNVVDAVFSLHFLPRIKPIHCGEDSLADEGFHRFSGALDRRFYLCFLCF